MISVKTTPAGSVAVFTGSDNTAIGDGALADNTTGDFNTATGHEALGLNGTGKSNTANGTLALFDNTTGSFNIAVGTGGNDCSIKGGCREARSDHRTTTKGLPVDGGATTKGN